jgi:hypothetical protein
VTGAALRAKLGILEQEIRDLGTVGSINCWQHLGIPDPLPGMLETAHDQAAGLRRAIVAADCAETAIAIVDTLMAAPGTCVPEHVASLTAEAIADALEAAHHTGHAAAHARARRARIKP